MASIKNKYEFYKGFLEALGAQDVAETEYKNEEELRKKILDTMGVEYVFDDVNQTDLFRGKLLEGLANGGGGSSDFSTAEVTVNSTDPIIQGSFVATDYLQNDSYGLTSPLQIALYKGKALIYLGNYEVSSVSGDISADEDGYYYVTGDCTINFSTN